MKCNISAVYNLQSEGSINQCSGTATDAQFEIDYWLAACWCARGVTLGVDVLVVSLIVYGTTRDKSKGRCW